jgi:two-component system response regulator YesN
MTYLLIADDEPWIVTGIRTLVERSFPEEFDIRCAANGRQAMELCRETFFDVLIIDVKMPKMGGLELVEYLRREGDRMHVIFISGYDEFALVHQALMLRSMDYLLKPIDEEKMVASLRRCLGWGEEQAVELTCDNRCVAAALEYVKKHYATGLTLEEVARHCAVSPEHLSRLFRKETGMNYMQVVTALRIDKAKRLLRSTTDKVYEIGFSVGYGDYRHFTKVFKQIEGMSPVEYRRQGGSREDEGQGPRSGGDAVALEENI